jgi:hypothetical protein
MFTLSVLADRLRSGAPTFSAWAVSPIRQLPYCLHAKGSTRSRSICSLMHILRRHGMSHAPRYSSGKARHRQDSVGEFATASRLLEAGAASVIWPRRETPEP